MVAKRKRKEPIVRDLEFAGYKFQSSPQGTVVQREALDPSRAGDYGADPLGDGTFRMVPSGDVVDFEERNRRLMRPKPNMSNKITQRSIKEFFKDDFDKAGVEDFDDAAVAIFEAIEKARASGRSEDADEALEITNRLIGGFGVEALRSEEAWNNYYGDSIALYVNTGDTYNGTLLYDIETGDFFLTTWGDWLEKWELDHDVTEDEAEPNARHARANMATRYSGDITVRLTYVDRPPPGTFHDNRGGYKATVSRGRDRATIWVGEPAHLTKAVDSPEAYDDAAKAAIAFAESDEGFDGSGAEYTRAGHLAVSRSRKARSNARRSMTFGHMPTKKEFTEAYDAALEEDGLDTYEIVFKGLDSRTADKAGYDSGDYSASELYDLVGALMNLYDQSDEISVSGRAKDEELYENAGSIASSIMETLGFEWV